MNRLQQSAILPCALIVALTLSTGFARGEDERERAGSGWLAWHYEGRALLNPTNGQGEVIGYFTYLEGVQGALFSGAPGEATAFFTFRSDVISFQPLPPNGNLNATLLDSGTFSIYYNSAPSGNWNDPDSFSSGKLVVTLARTPVELVAIGPVLTSIFSATLAETHDFTFDGKVYNFKRLFPNGITNYATGTTSPVAGTTEFPVALPYAGSAQIVGKSHSEWR